MKCCDSLDKLDLYAIEGLDKSDYDEITAHLKDCGECRKELEDIRKSIDLFRSAYPSDTSPNANDLVELAKADEQPVLYKPYYQMMKVAALFVICAGISFSGIKLVLNQEPCACRPWQKDGVAAVNMFESDYPFVSGKRIFALKKSEQDGLHLIAMKKGSGNQVWESSFTVLDGAISEDESNIYIWTADQLGKTSVASVSKSDGSLKWTVECAAGSRPSSLSRPLASNGMVYWTEGSLLRSVHASSGKDNWSSELPGRSSLSSPAVSAGSVYVASSKSLFALDIKTGKMMWQKSIPGASIALMRPKLVCKNSHMYFASAHQSAGKLHRIDPADGSIVWSQSTETPLSIRVTKNKILLRGVGLEAFDISTGTRAWRSDIGGCSPVAIYRNKVLAVNNKAAKEVIAIDIETGTTSGTIPLAASCSGLVVGGNMGYMSGQNGILYAINIKES